ncbi:MAG: hypothetical protein P8107_14545 [Spirochaetia bacterium]
MRFLFFIIGGLFIFACVHMPPSQLTPAENSRLQAAAGNNWTIKSGGDKIIIESKTPYWFYNAVSLPPMSEDEFIAYIKRSGHRDYYRITLLLVPRWSRQKIDEARRHNDDIRKKVSTLPQKYGLTHLSRTKQNSFFPETEADKEKIKRFEAERDKLEAELTPIPEYYSEHYSIFWHDNREGFEAVWAEDMHMDGFRQVFSRY